MKVRDVMTKEVTTVAPSTSLRDVAAIMSERGISGLPVVRQGDDIVGVVSEADILMRERTPGAKREGVLARLLGPRDGEIETKLDARTAADAMTTPAITVDPSTPIPRAAALMIERRVNRLPVVEKGALVGIVTRADLVRAFTRDDAEIRREIEDDVVVKQLWIAPGTVAVTVSGGEVGLRGTVEKRSLADLLTTIVERVPGVVSVASEVSWQEDDRA